MTESQPRRIVHKLYLSALSMCTLLAVTVTIGSGAVQVHDHIVVSNAFDCHRAAIAEEQRTAPNLFGAKFKGAVLTDSITARTKCGMIADLSVVVPSANAAWADGYEQLAKDRFTAWATYSGFSLVPLVVLAAINEWIRWLMK